MIQFVKLKCPQCGGKMKKVDETSVTCPYCGMTYLLERDQIVPEKQPAKASHTVNPDEILTTKQKVIRCVAVFAIVLVIIIGINIAASIQEQNKEVDTDSEKIVTSVPKQEYPERPVSDLYQEFMEHVFNKEYSQITEQEVQTITFLHTYSNEGLGCADYIVGDKPMNTFSIAGDIRGLYADIDHMTGLVTLNAESYTFRDGTLTNLSDLKELHAGNAISEIVQLVSNPEQLEILELCKSEESLTGLDTFPNLTKLIIDNHDLKDIGALSALKKLETLEIKAGDQLKNIGVIGTLSQLKRVLLDADRIKDISIVKNLANLEEFELYDTDVISIDPLKGKAILKKLVLSDNRDLKCVDAVSTLKGLEELSLSFSYDIEPPDMKALTKLTKLTVSGAEDISFLKPLTKLKYLDLSGYDISGEEGITSLKELEYLKLGILGYDLMDLTKLNKLPKLLKLDISNANLFQDISSLINLPALRELNLSGCTFELEPDKVTENKTLELLRMDNVKQVTNSYVEHAGGGITNVYYDDVCFANQLDFISKLSNLKELHLAKNELTDVDSMTKLSKLETIDISENYITDLRPLLKLTKLKTVYCADNPISQGSDLGEGINVVNSVD